jgi:hypothetical protein
MCSVLARLDLSSSSSKGTIKRYNWETSGFLDLASKVATLPVERCQLGSCDGFIPLGVIEFVHDEFAVEQ